MALAAHQRWMTMLGYLAGKWPHSQSIQPGGSAKPLGAMERSQLLMRLSEMRQFLERQLFGASLEQVSACQDLDSLHELANHGQGDLALFLTVAKDLQLQTLGPGPGRFMSYGAHPDFTVDHVNTHEAHTHAGIWFDGQVHALDLQGITEDCTHAWLEDAASALHPSQGHTHPVADKPGAYTWNKAPRLHGQVLETGASAAEQTRFGPRPGNTPRRQCAQPGGGPPAGAGGGAAPNARLAAINGTRSPLLPAL
jgi:hydrogenase large subunit